MTPSEFTAARTALGMSQGRLAVALNVNIRSVSRWENGHQPIPQLVALALEGLRRKTMATYTTARHPSSGETYAVKIDADGMIVEAAGPLAYDDPRDEDAIYGWLSNHSDTAAEDAEWLQAAIDKSLGN